MKSGMEGKVSDMAIIKNGSTVIYKIRENAKPKVGKVEDMCWMNGGIRYKIYRKVKGRFLNGETMWEALHKKETTVEDTRWTFIVWLKPERIVKIL